MSDEYIMAFLPEVLTTKYWKKYFNVTDEDVKKRIKTALWHDYKDD